MAYKTRITKKQKVAILFPSGRMMDAEALEKHNQVKIISYGFLGKKHSINKAKKLGYTKIEDYSNIPLSAF